MADQLAMLHTTIDTTDQLAEFIGSFATGLDLTDTAARFRLRQQLSRGLRSSSTERVQGMLRLAGASGSADPSAALVRWYTNRTATAPTVSPRVETIERVIVPAEPTDTQRRAAATAAKVARPRRVQVLLAIAARGSNGATDDELVAALSMSPNTVRPRRVELVNAGLVTDSGTRRESAYGNPAIVWVLTIDGITAAQAHNAEAA